MKLLSRTLLDELAAKAAASPRARAHYNIHATKTRSELALIVRGRLDVLTFDERGRVTARYGVGDGTASIAYETPQGTWHTVVPGAAGGAFLEVKEGPYDPATSSEFAAWAPAEGHALVPKFLEWLRSAQPGDTPPA